MTKNVFFDSSAFKAIVDPKDEFHKSSIEILAKLQEEKIVAITSNFILDESYTVIRIKCGVDSAFRLKDYLVNKIPNIKIYRVTLEDEQKAWSWFEKRWSKLSFTDCVSFAQMKRLGLEHVFTFDKHYAQVGFSIVK